MCDKCGKYEPAKSPEEVHFETSSLLVDFIREKQIEEVVKNHGLLVIATSKKDWDENGNFIGDYSREHKIAKKYERKHFPERFAD